MDEELAITLTELEAGESIREAGYIVDVDGKPFLSAEFLHDMLLHAQREAAISGLSGDVNMHAAALAAKFCEGIRTTIVNITGLDTAPRPV